MRKHYCSGKEESILILALMGSTPTLVFADGSRHAGFMKAEQLENMLEKPN
jgi:hypothetical protein